MGKLIDITGKKFGRLTVISKEESKRSCAYWNCECECGTQIIVSSQNLRTGHTKSCGCICRTQNGHGHGRIYSIFNNMHKRCYDSNNKKYKNYGGKGIIICEEWQDFLTFREWVLNNGYNDELELDRIDNKKGYSPGNCKFSTRRQQMMNMSRNTKFVGVCYDKSSNSYKAYLYKNGKQYQKHFGITTHGNKAYELAKKARLQMEKEHNIKVVRA